MKHFHLFFFAMLLLAACSETTLDEQVDENERIDTTVFWLEHLDKLDKQLLAAEELNVEKGWEAFTAFRLFARKNPEHPKAPLYHMKAAAIARNIPGKALMAIEEYMTVYKMYPKDTLAPQAHFLVGFTFDQALNDNERAVKAYKGFVDQYPEHMLADQARNRIAAMESGKDDLQQVKDWQKQAQ